MMTISFTGWLQAASPLPPIVPLGRFGRRRYLGASLRYQRVKVVTPAGAVNVWLPELSPLNAPVLPTRAAAAPLWATVDVAVLPALVHAVRPDSKPPLVSPAGGGGNVALMLTSS